MPATKDAHEGSAAGPTSSDKGGANPGVATDGGPNRHSIDGEKQLKKSTSELSFEGYDDPSNTERPDDSDDDSPRGASNILPNASKQQAPIPVQWPERNEEAFQRGKAVRFVKSAGVFKLFPCIHGSFQGKRVLADYSR